MSAETRSAPAEGEPRLQPIARGSQKYWSLLGSGHDGEVVAAARKAEADCARTSG